MRNIECLHDNVCLIRNSRVPSYGSDWLTGIVVNQGLDLIKKLGGSFLVRTIKVRLSSYYTFGIPIGQCQIFTNPLHSKKIHTKAIWKLCISVCECQAVQHPVFKFLEDWIASWCCFPHRHCPTDSSFLLRKQNLKQTTCDK